MRYNEKRQDFLMLEGHGEYLLEIGYDEYE
jgi:hypothetical protein